VRGVVHDEDGKPVAGARVTRAYWEKGEWKETTEGAASGPDGKFSLRAPEAGWVRLDVRHPEFVFLQFPVQVGAAAEVEVVLRRGVRVSVLVLHPDRRPAEGATVRAVFVASHGVPGMWRWLEEQPIAVVRTGPDGRAPLGAAPEGTLQVTVDHADYPPAKAEVAVRGPGPTEQEVLLSVGGGVSGRVLDPEGKPVAGATVHATGDDARKAVSGEDGSYVLSPLGSGPVTVMAEAEGHGPGFFGERLGWGEPVPVPVAPGRVVEGIDIVLGRPSFLRGRVVDAGGKGVAGVTVYGGVWPSFGEARPAETDAEGRFRVGPWTVRRDAQAWTSFRSEDWSVNGADQQRIAPGADLDLGEFRATALGIVRGRVVDEEGRPVREGWVGLGDDFTGVSPDGTFELRGVPPGEFGIRARSEGPPVRVSGPVAVVVTAGTPLEGVTIRVEPALAIAGVVRTKSGEPRTRVCVGAMPKEGDEVASEAFPAADGSFALAGLRPGAYRVGLLRLQGDSIIVEGEFLPRPEPVAAEAGTAGLVLVAEPQGGAVKGVVRSASDGKPLRRFQVHLIRFEGFVPNDFSTEERESADGSFRVEVEEAGTYAVEVSADGHAPLRTTPAPLAEGKVRDLGVLSLGTGGIVRGTVRDARGDPVPYVRIHLLSPKMETNEDEPFTDLEGRYELRGISPGTYTVFAVSPRHPLGMVRPVAVEEGKTATADVAFLAPAPLTVTVTDAEGKPLPGVDLSYTFDAVRPLNSRLFRDKEPPGWGPHQTDANGVIVKPCLPAGDVTIYLNLKGWQTKAETVALEPGRANAVTVVLEKK